MSDTELIQAYKEGSEDAATELHTRYERRLLGLVESRYLAAKQRDEGKDVVQSVMRTFFNRVKVGLIEADQENLSSLLCTIARCKTARRLRQQATLKRGGDLKQMAILAEELIAIPQEEDAIHFEKLVQEFEELNQNKPSKLDTFHLLCAGYSMNKIASELKIAIGSVKDYRDSIRRWFTERLEREDVNDE